MDMDRSHGPGTAAATCRKRSARAVPPSSANVATVTIVVPTLREAANLQPLAKRVARALADAGIAWEPLFMENDSGDGSTGVAAELAAERLPVRLTVRCGERPDPRVPWSRASPVAGSTASW